MCCTERRECAGTKRFQARRKPLGGGGAAAVPAGSAEEAAWKAKDKRAFEDGAKQNLEPGAAAAGLFRFAPYFK
ncbi:MAG TPA: hypothetical protein IAB57_06725 [Candidatus Fimivivens faecavium]|nr:hypothetical protein [Candidatus Fimivivens faecavium]